MKFLYDIGINLAEFHLKLIAKFHQKLQLGVQGRSETFSRLEKEILLTDRVFWFHCASLGEYEQGLPVFKELRKNYPHHKIVLTFFSPSGYEIRKHTEVADVVVYLPMDTKSNAIKFIDCVHPELTIFVKYDIWPNYLFELKKRNLKAILISASFRKSQSYFQWYGRFMKQALTTFEKIFVQKESSKTLLKSVDIDNVIVAGDTRYDRVSNQLEQDNLLPFIEEFKDNKLCVVIGSSWPEDEEILVRFINAHSDQNIKFIIAPHNIKRDQIDHLKEQLKTSYILFTEKEGKNLSSYNVFITDTIGILSKIYSYADIAYVGGAMGNTGLHNILEPAVFGVPIIIGKNYKKFPEASEMISEAGVVSVSNYTELENILIQLIANTEKRDILGKRNSSFIRNNKGAVIQIVKTIRI